ncbi:hypothetical protein V2J09_001492 [Rumex salicifolius]
MKITSSTALSAAPPQSSKPHHENTQSAHTPPSLRPDLPRKPAHRKLCRRRTAVVTARTPRKDVGSSAAGKRTGPATPLLRWKFDEVEDNERDSLVGDDENLPVEGVECRKVRRGGRAASARKLAAVLWRLQAPEAVADADAEGAERRLSRKVEDKLGFMSQASLKFSNYAMEGVTKWDPVSQKKTKEPSNSKLLDEKLKAISKASALQSELEQAQSRIEELESEKRSSKKRLEHFLRKLSEEKAAWRSREHEKVRAIIDGMKADLHRERKNRQRLEIINSKLVNELAEAKVVTKRYMQDYEKERKSRELIEEVCDELAKEIGEDKADIEALKKDCMKIQEEADDERKMLQMAEVWREERVQMKLVDAKVTLEDKFSQMNKIIADLECFLSSKNGALVDAKEIKELEMLKNAVASVNIQDIKEFSYDPPKSDDVYSVFEEMLMGETSDASKMQTMNPEMNTHGEGKIYELSDAYGSENGEVEDDVSGWETVSHADDQGSSYSCEESIASINKMLYRDSNVSGHVAEWEENKGDETPVSGISEVCSVQSKQNKKVSAISRLWKSGLNNSEKYKLISVDGLKSRFSDGRISTGSSITSTDHGSKRGGSIPFDLASNCSSSDTGNPHFGRGMKGCIEWPLGQKTSLKSKLLEARMESQKVQLRQVLKQEM